MTNSFYQYLTIERSGGSGMVTVVIEFSTMNINHAIERHWVRTLECFVFPFVKIKAS